jgi:hypothetical protein
VSDIPLIVIAATNVVSVASGAPYVRILEGISGWPTARKAAIVLGTSIAVFNTVAIPLGMGWKAQTLATILSLAVLAAGYKFLAIGEVINFFIKHTESPGSEDR